MYKQGPAETYWPHGQKYAAQVSLLNFLRYNVGGGGDSALYGVEGPGFYLRSGALALNAALPLAAAAPLALLIGRGRGRPGAWDSCGKKRKNLHTQLKPELSGSSLMPAVAAQNP